MSRNCVRMAEEHGERESFIAAQTGELSAQEEKQRALESEMQAAQSSLESLRTRRDEAAQLASEVARQVATLEERRRGAVVAVERIEAMAVRGFGASGQAESATGIGRRREAAA